MPLILWRVTIDSGLITHSCTRLRAEILYSLYSLFMGNYSCLLAAFTIRTQRRIALAMPIVPEAGVVGTNERKTGCQLVNRMDFRVRHECNHKCVVFDQLVWPYCVVKVCL